MHRCIPPVLVLLLLLPIPALASDEAPPEAPEATVAPTTWYVNPRPILVHKLFVATYLQLWRNPEEQQASFSVKADSSVTDWVRVKEVLLTLDGSPQRFPCVIDKVQLNWDPLNPVATAIDNGEAACEIPYETSEALLTADRVEVGFVVGDRTLDPKKLKPKQLARLRQFTEAARR